MGETTGTPDEDVQATSIDEAMCVMTVLTRGWMMTRYGTFKKWIEKRFSEDTLGGHNMGNNAWWENLRAKLTRPEMEGAVQTIIAAVYGVDVDGFGARP